MWTRQELEDTFPCADKKYLDALFAKRKKVTVTNIVNARSIPMSIRQYGIWQLDYRLWREASSESIRSAITTDNWRKFAKAVKTLDKENN